MALCLRIKRRNAHETMHAGFILEIPINILAFDFDSQIAKSSMIVFIVMQNRIGIILPLEICIIHFKQHSCEIFAVISACTGKMVRTAFLYQASLRRRACPSIPLSFLSFLAPFLCHSKSPQRFICDSSPAISASSSELDSMFVLVYQNNTANFLAVSCLLGSANEKISVSLSSGPSRYLVIDRLTNPKCVNSRKISASSLGGAVLREEFGNTVRLIQEVSTAWVSTCPISYHFCTYLLKRVPSTSCISMKHLHEGADP
jgi:hypothetical protein